VIGLVEYNPNIAWEVPNDPSLKEFLEPTTYGDMENPLIQEMASKIIRGAETPKEAAIKIWNFMVDEIRWCYEPPKPVARVLIESEGNCFNKTNLQLSLLRFNGIPARYTYDLFYSKFAGIVVTPVLIKHKSIVHTSAEIYIDGRWIQSDAWLDREVLPYRHQWNGKDDLCVVAPDYIWKNLGYTQGILLNELNEQFGGAGRTKESCHESVDPYTDWVRKLSKDEQVTHYEDILGKEYTENFGRYLYLRSVPYDAVECLDIRPPRPPDEYPSQKSIMPR